MSEWIVASGSNRDKLGEGPIWSERRDAVLWVDIVGRSIKKLIIGTGLTEIWNMPDRLGWVIERSIGDGLLVGLRTGVAAFDPVTSSLDLLCSPERDRPQNRLNDAKTDVQGRLWFGSKDDSDKQSSGALYRLETDLRCKRIDDGYLVTNGPAFSLDGRTMWHSDSGRRIVYAFDLDENGDPQGRRDWLRFPEAWGFPDGMTVDCEGGVWIAHWGGARVSRFSPDGELDRSISLPATNITSVTFAGCSLDRMFVTSSSLGFEHERLAGALFELRPNVRGVAPVPFAG